MKTGTCLLRTPRPAERQAFWTFLLAGLCLLLSPSVRAVGFGQLISQSPLDRPLDVVFPVVLDEADGDASRFNVVRIAGDSVYASLDTKRADLLNSATVTVEPAGDRVLVHVRSVQRVLEPYLALIVEIPQASGVLRHRYDILLDPVTEGSAAAADQSQPQTAADETPAMAAAPPAATAGSANSRTAASRQPPASRRHGHAGTAAASAPAAAAVPSRAAAAAVPPARFQLDPALHMEMPPGAPAQAIPAPAIPLPAAPAQPTPAAAEPPAATANVPAPSPNLPANPPAKADAAAPTPQPQPQPPKVPASAPVPPPAPASSGHMLWLDLAILLLLLWGLRQAWRSGLLDRQLVQRLRGSAHSGAQAPQTQYVPMAGVHAQRGTADQVRRQAAAARRDSQSGPKEGGAQKTAGMAPYIAPSRQDGGTSQGKLGRPDGIEVIDASGFYDDIALLLEQTLQREPKRLDLYHKLIEVYVAANKPQQALRIRRQLEALVRNPTGGVDNLEARRVLQQVEELLPREADAAEAAQITTAPQGAGWTRYYEGPGFEALAEHLEPVRAAYAEFRRDTMLQQTFIEVINEEVGRPTPLQPALQFSRKLGGAHLYFKREDLRLAGSEVIVNCIGQMLLMRSMGKLGVATAVGSVNGARAVVAAAKALGMPSTVFITPEGLDMLDAELLELAQKHQVEFLPARDPKDARRDALACWMENSERLGYVTGLRAGPAPFPTIVMDFIAVVGQETRRQLLRYSKRDPAVIVGSAFGGFSSIGFVKPYLENPAVRVIMTDPPPGFGGDDAALPARPAGAVGYEMALREHRWLHASGRVNYLAVDAGAARQARLDCDQIEEFMPKPADAAAIGMGLDIARTLPEKESVVVLLSAVGS
jgi:tryptophan synthase beta chain